MSATRASRPRPPSRRITLRSYRPPRPGRPAGRTAARPTEGPETGTSRARPPAARRAGVALLYSPGPRQPAGSPATRRSAVARGRRVVRPVRRARVFDQPRRRTVGATRERCIQVPGHRARGFFHCRSRSGRPPDAGHGDRRAPVGRRGQGQDDRLPRRAGRDGRPLPGRRQRRPHRRQRRRGLQAPPRPVGRAVPAHHVGHRQRRRRQPGDADRASSTCSRRAASTSSRVRVSRRPT